MSTPSLDAIDRRLAKVDTIVQHMGENLVELDADVTRQMLGASPSLTGRTAEAWRLADAQLADLWRGHVALKDLLEAIAHERGTRSSVPRAALGRVAALLDGPSVSLPSPDPTGHRTLTEGADPTVPCTIDELIDQMSAGYDSVVALVTAVGSVWTETVPELTALEAQVDRLEATVRETGCRPPNDLAAARRALAEAQATARHDPLSLPAGLAPSITVTVDRATASIRDAAAANRQLAAERADLSSALDDGDARLRRARAECRAIVERIVLPHTVWEDLDRAEAELVGLHAEFAALTATAGDGAAARRSVAALARRTDRLSRHLARLEDCGATDLAKRDELRGRLDAYRAKARAIGLGEDIELDRRQREADELLYSAPCDVRRAEDLVSQFERAVRAGDEGAR
ncbi:MAG: hypothetical protein ACLPVF_14470 [Acidimicrobiales bacterium]